MATMPIHLFTIGILNCYEPFPSFQCLMFPGGFSFADREENGCNPFRLQPRFPQSRDVFIEVWQNTALQRMQLMRFWRKLLRLGGRQFSKQSRDIWLPERGNMKACCGGGFVLTFPYTANGCEVFSRGCPIKSTQPASRLTNAQVSQ